MRRKSVIAIVVVAILVATLSGHLWYRWSPWGTIVRGPGYEGLLMKPMPGRRVADWRPSLGDIQQMEAALTSFVSGNPQLFNSSVPVEPSAYLRHYWGFEKAGIRFIGATFLRKGFVTRQEWLGAVIVADGAAHDNWRISWCPDTKTFSGLSPFPIERAREDRQPSPGAYSGKAADGLPENAQE